MLVDVTPRTKDLSKSVFYAMGVCIGVVGMVDHWSLTSRQQLARVRSVDT